MADKASMAELELTAARAREGLADWAEAFRRKTDVRENWRFLIARTRQRWHRDRTPLVAIGVTVAGGVAAIAIGFGLRGSDAGRLDAVQVLPTASNAARSAGRAKAGRVQKPDKKSPEYRARQVQSKQSKRVRKQIKQLG